MKKEETLLESDAPKKGAGKRSLSIPNELLAKADERAAHFRYRKFSHYVTALIESDIFFAGGQSDFLHNRPLPPNKKPKKSS